MLWIGSEAGYQGGPQRGLQPGEANAESPTCYHASLPPLWAGWPVARIPIRACTDGWTAP